MRVEGELTYQGPDDPPMEYYLLRTRDGKQIMIGFDSENWGGNIHDGIPQLPENANSCTLEITDGKCDHPAQHLKVYNMRVDNRILRSGSTNGITDDLFVTQMHYVINCTCSRCGQKVDIENTEKPVEHGDWSKAIYF